MRLYSWQEEFLLELFALRFWQRQCQQGGNEKRNAKNEK